MHFISLSDSHILCCCLFLKKSSMYGRSMETIKPVPKGRMRLPSIVRTKELPKLPNSNRNRHGDNGKSITKQGKSRQVMKRKRTKGWFAKGSEPAAKPIGTNVSRKGGRGFYAKPQTAYNPLVCILVGNLE